jgi:hypothetical protein
MAEKSMAIGTWEASCVMGVHWTTVARMVEKEMIEARDLKSTVGNRVFRVYSLADCEANYAGYERVCRQNGGHSPKHPRTMTHMRHDALERLHNETAKISFIDAVSSAEAAEIMGIHHSFCVRMALDGKISGRVMWSGRPDSESSRLWIFSRKSCEKNRDGAIALVKNGTKTGRPRSFLDQ